MIASVARSPSRTRAPLATRPAKSRVVVAGEAPVMDLYFPAERPPGNPSGPSPKHAQECPFLPLIERRSSSFVLSIRKGRYARKAPHQEEKT
jgi:hypothetical protein